MSSTRNHPERLAWRKGAMLLHKSGQRFAHNAYYFPADEWAIEVVAATDAAIVRMLRTAAQESGDA